MTPRAPLERPKHRRIPITVRSRTVRPGAARRWRWVFAAVMVLAAAGGVAAWRLRPVDLDRDPERLGLLKAALGQFNAGRYDQARALLDRRAYEVARRHRWTGCSAPGSRMPRASTPRRSTP